MATVTNTLTDSITLTYTGSGKAVSSKVGTYTGTRAVDISDVVTAGTTNKLYTIAVAHLSIVAMIMDGSQNLTVLTNSTSTPGNTFNLQAGIGFAWANNYLAALPVTVDITALYVSNASATDSTFNVRFLLA